MINRLITGQDFIDLESKVNAIPNIQLILNRDPSNLCYNPDFLVDTNGWSDGITRTKINSIFVGSRSTTGKIQFGEKISTYAGDMFYISLSFSNSKNNKCDIKLKASEFDSSASLITTQDVESKVFTTINDDSFINISNIYKISNVKAAFVLFYYQFTSSINLPVYFTRHEIKKVGFLANYLVSNNIAAGDGLNLEIIDGRNILSAKSATLTDRGITSLCDDLNTDNSTIALTAKQGKALNDSKLDKTGVAQTALWAAQTAARKIGGVVFNSKSDIDLPGVNIKGNQDTSGNANTATKLKNPVNINNVPFDGTSNITIETIPVGAIQLFIVDTIPEGWLKANGAEISRTLYSDLFKLIGTKFGEGDGNTTFNLPDLRGEFLRVWDDARGIDPNRELGSFQDQQLLQHTHGLISWTGNKLLERMTSGIPNLRWFGVGTVYGDGGILYSDKSAVNHMEGNRITPTDTVYDAKGANVGNQLIVRNISLLACIKV